MNFFVYNLDTYENFIFNNIHCFAVLQSRAERSIVINPDVTEFITMNAVKRNGLHLG